MRYACDLGFGVTINWNINDDIRGRVDQGVHGYSGFILLFECDSSFICYAWSIDGSLHLRQVFRAMQSHKSSVPSRNLYSHHFDIRRSTWKVGRLLRLGFGRVLQLLDSTDPGHTDGWRNSHSYKDSFESDGRWRILRHLLFVGYLRRYSRLFDGWISTDPMARLTENCSGCRNSEFDWSSECFDFE